MWTYIKKYKKIITLYIFVSLLLVFINFLPSIFNYFLIQVIIQPSFKQIEFIIWILLTSFALLFSGFSNTFFDFFKTKLTLKLEKKIKLSYAGKFAEMSFKVYNSENVGKYLSLLNNDANEMVQKSCILFIDLAADFLYLFFGIITLFFFNWIIGLILLPFIIIYAFLPNFFQKKLKKLNDRYFKSLENFNQKTKNMLDGYLLLYLTDKKNVLNQEIKKESIEISKSKLLLIKLEIINNVFYNFFFYFSDFIIIVANALIVLFITNIDANLFFFVPTLSLIIFNMLFLPTISQRAQSFSRNLLAMKGNDVLFQKFENINNLRNENLNVFNEDFEKFSLANINYDYSDKNILKDFSYVFEKNKKYAIVGPSGVGKSTILKILLGIHHDYKGSAKINDVEINTINPKYLYNYINYLDSSNFMFDATIKDNITLFETNTSNAKITTLLQQLNLKEFINNNNVLGKNNYSLSTGQKQRIDLARKLYQPKPILIIDEGLANLDDNNALKIENLLLQQKNLTFIFVTHHFKNEMRNKYDDVIYL